MSKLLITSVSDDSEVTDHRLSEFKQDETQRTTFNLK